MVYIQSNKTMVNQRISEP